MTLPGQPGSVVPAGEDWVPRELAALRSENREAVASVAKAFAPVIADLQTKQAALEAVVADLAVLVAEQVKPAVGNATTGVTPFATSTSASNHAGVTFTVPSGYTSAAVMGVSAITSFVRNHTCRTLIAASLGDFVEVGIDNAGASAHTAILTGLSGGGTFTVYTQVMANAAGGFCHAMTSVSVTYYR